MLTEATTRTPKVSRCQDVLHVLEVLASLHMSPVLLAFCLSCLGFKSVPCPPAGNCLQAETDKKGGGGGGRRRRRRKKRAGQRGGSCVRMRENDPAACGQTETQSYQRMVLIQPCLYSKVLVKFYKKLKFHLH